METFPHATMAVVLELRDALKDPLVRYRQAIIKISDEFRFSPIDAEFSRAASTAYAEKVVPELLHLRELAKEKRVHSLLRHAARSGIPGKAAAAIAGFVGASAAQMPAVIGGAIGVGLDVVAEVSSRRQQLTDQQQQNAYFYLFEGESRSKP
jgi:hypothetical protein